MSLYANTKLDVVPSKGGSICMTIASNAAQGNAGTSLPCKKVWLIANATDVRVTIGVACTATTGIPVPYFDATLGAYLPLQLEIDDVSSLYFYGGTDAKVVDCLYRL